MLFLANNERFGHQDTADAIRWDAISRMPSDIRIPRMPSGSTTIDHREKDHYTHKDHSEKDSDIRIQQKDFDISLPRMPSGVQ